MGNSDLKLKEIFTSTKLTKRQKILNAEKMLIEELKINPADLELYFKLAVVVLEEPEVDFIMSIECMEKVLIFERENEEAAIFLSWLQYFHRGYVSSNTIMILDDLLDKVKVDSLSESLIYLSKSWSDEISEEQRHYFLKKSVESNGDYVDNCLELSKSQLNRGNLNKGKHLLIKALGNVEGIYLMDNSFSITTVEPYLGDQFKGIVNIPTYDVPTYGTLKKESILRTIIDSHTVNNILRNIKTL